jgi:hypothetical protein
MHTLHLGDCLDILRTLPDNSVDAVVTDPPYGLSFMGKRWDYDVPSEDVWRECLRVLKPGGHLLAFAGTRTQHRMAVRIEDAGFEIRDMIAWVYGSGFPKSLDVGKAIDKAAGAEREVVGAYQFPDGHKRVSERTASDRVGQLHGDKHTPITAPATDAARQWQGWGTALKPALEPITVARKPLIGTVAENVLTWGTGGVNVDGCRIESGGTHGSARSAGQGAGYEAHNTPGRKYGDGLGGIVSPPHSLGRWPANLIHDGSDEVVGGFPETGGGGKCQQRYRADSAVPYAGRHRPEFTPYEDTANGGGSAARFFYCAKASKRDRDEGLDSIEIINIFASWEKEDLRARLLVDTATLPPKVTVESTAQHKNASAWSTLLFGSPFMDQFQTGTKYTTATGTNSTTGSRTLSALMRCITSGSIQGVSLEATDGTNRAENAGSLATLTITIDEATALALGVNHVQYPMRFTINARDGSNIHSTVKPTDLMRYLCRLVTPPGGIVLDPFMGSGSTGKAAILEDFAFIGIEREAEYLEIARARIEHAINNKPNRLL